MIHLAQQQSSGTTSVSVILDAPEGEPSGAFLFVRDSCGLVLLSGILSTSGTAPVTPGANLALCDSYGVIGPSSQAQTPHLPNGIMPSTFFLSYLSYSSSFSRTP